MFKARLITSFLFCLAGYTNIACAQQYLMDNSPVNACAGSFYDSGGPADDYQNNESYTKTFCPDGASGTHMQLSFSFADIDPGDELCIYDGQSVGSPQLSCASQYQPGQPFIVRATAANPSGCLTVNFTSTNTGAKSGWAATLSCEISCQTVLSELFAADPPVVPMDTGWIDICPGQAVRLAAGGIYPQNNLVYEQNDNTSTFEWTFGDGDTQTGADVTHVFEKSGGYYVRLLIRDIQGCPSTNLLQQRVRVAARPDFFIDKPYPPAICINDTISLSATTDTAFSANLKVKPTRTSFDVSGTRADSLALPDGTGVPYQTGIFFDNFPPGVSLSDPNDITVCVNIEHSWLRDLKITLTCPTGQSIQLHNYAGKTGSQCYLGEPIDSDGFNPVPGKGYDYCWTNGATNSTWLNYINAQPVPILPPDDYLPFNNFGNLLGCPLNGEWKISVEDGWPMDNGFIFSWSLRFKSSLYPPEEAFITGFSDWTWQAASAIFALDPDSISAAPDKAGTAYYRFEVTDDFGCNWDTALTVKVLPPVHPDCHQCTDIIGVLPDTTICIGESVALNLDVLPPDFQSVCFLATPAEAFSSAVYTTGNPYLSGCDVDGLAGFFIADPLIQIESVCINLSAGDLGSLSFFLRSPNGKLLELSSANGAGATSLAQTCFTPTAFIPIASGMPAFTGDFIPEGDWNELNGALINGTWQLLIYDTAGSNQSLYLSDWSITFQDSYNLAVSWTNSASLSCQDCLTPVATPASPTVYIANVFDRYGCMDADTVSVDILPQLEAPEGLVYYITDNEMVFSWNPVSGASSYEVSLNGGPWMPSNGSLSHLVNGLVFGDSVRLEVRAQTTSALCPALSSGVSSVYVLCTMQADLAGVNGVTCFGAADGSVFINVSNALPPVDYLPDGGGPVFTNGDILNIFEAGNHFVLVRDSSGCVDTVFFFIPSPQPLKTNASAQAVDCHGKNTGILTAMPEGGMPPYNYVWQNCSGGPVLTGNPVNNVFAGCYYLTLTDNLGCKGLDTVTVAEPPPLSASAQQTPATCFGFSDGIAWASASGGTQPYGFQWQNSSINDSLTGLSAGTYFFTITDAAGCKAASFVEVKEPAALALDSILTTDAKCFGASDAVACAFSSGGTSPYSYIWSNGQTGQKVQGFPAGLASITLTDNNGCMLSQSFDVFEPTDLLTNVISVEPERCALECNGKAGVQITGGTAPYDVFWIGGSFVPPGSTFWNALCPGGYTLIIIDHNLCADTLQFTIDPALPINIVLTPQSPSCPNAEDGALTAAVSGGTPAYQFLWSTGSTVGPELNKIACGQYTVTVTDDYGCSNVQTATLVCPDSIEVVSFSLNHPDCFKSADGSISLNVIGGAQPLQFLWNDPAQQKTPSAVQLTAGIYTATITDFNGCTKTASAELVEPDSIHIGFQVQNIPCFGDKNGSVEAKIEGGVKPYAVIWSTSDTLNAISGLSAGIYSITATDATGCSKIGNVEVVQPALPLKADPLIVHKACYKGQNGIAKIIPSGGNGLPYQIMWSTGVSGSQAQNLPKGVYTATVVDAKGCSVTVPIVMEEYDSIKVNVVFIGPTCFGKSDAKLAVNLLEGGALGSDSTLYHYAWNVPGIGNKTYASGLPGDKTYAVTVTDTVGCTGKYSFFLPQPKEIEFSLNIDSVSCFGQNDGSISASGILFANLPVVYQWSNAETDASISGLPPGTYSVTLSDQKGCSSAETVVLAEPPLLTLSVTASPLRCSSGADGKIEAVAGGGSPGYVYAWTNGASGAQVENLSAGIYTLTLTDSRQCSLTATAEVEAPDGMEVTIDFTPPNCFGQSTGKISIDVEGGKPPFVYALNQGSYQAGAVFIALKSDYYTISVKDQNDCIEVLDSVFLPQPALVDVMLDAGKTEMDFGDSTLISSTVLNGFGALQYEWSSALVEEIPWQCSTPDSCTDIQVFPSFSNTYRLVVTDEKGCTGSDKIDVVVEKPRGIFVPTAFSPNGDLNNDLLSVFGKVAQVDRILRFQIFDRWGELIYEADNFSLNDPNIGWDGRFRGSDCDPGVYVWLIEALYKDGFRESLSGNSVLIR